MKKIVGKTRKLGAIWLIATMAILGSAQTALAATQHSYTFNYNVPPTGYVFSSSKALPAYVPFKNNLQTCLAIDGSGQGSKGVLFKSMLYPNGQFLSYVTQTPGSGTKTLVTSTNSNRTIYVGLQAVGTVKVKAQGYWYY